MMEEYEDAFGDSLEIDEEEAIKAKLIKSEPLTKEECEVAWDAYFMEDIDLFMALVKQDAFPAELIPEAYEYTGCQNRDLDIEDLGILMDKSSPELLQEIADWSWGDAYMYEHLKNELQTMAKERLAAA